MVLVDDHPIVLQGLRQLFERQLDFSVAACCADMESAFAAVTAHHPDVLLLDLRLGGEDGLDLLRRLSLEGSTCRTVILTAAINDDEVLEAVKFGARGLVLKESPPATLLNCVRLVHAGEQSLDHKTLTRAFTKVLDREAAVREASQDLTPREIEITCMVAEGLRNRAIGARLGISEATVKTHLHNIYEKLGVDGRIGLTLCAQQKGLV
jgi:DNA-binding NarL/FixJ family response regulator